MDPTQIYRQYPHLRIGYGSITGRLRAIPTTAAAGAKYRVTEQQTGREVECIIPDALSRQAADAAAEKRRVVMSGKLYRNEDGVKQKMAVSEILVMPEPRELPSLDELAGSLPNITGGRSVEEHLRILRSEGYDDYPEPDDD